MRFLDCKKSKAYEVIAIVKKKYNGNSNFGTGYVKRDSVLAFLDTSIERECYIAEQVKKGGNDETLRKGKV